MRRVAVAWQWLLGLKRLRAAPLGAAAGPLVGSIAPSEIVDDLGFSISTDARGYDGNRARYVAMSMKKLSYKP